MLAKLSYQNKRYTEHRPRLINSNAFYAGMFLCGVAFMSAAFGLSAEPSGISVMRFIFSLRLCTLTEILYHYSTLFGKRIDNI